MSNQRTIIGLLLIMFVFLLCSQPVLAAQDIDEAIKKLADKISVSMAEKNKTKIAVIPFQDLSSDVVTTLGKYIAEELTTALFNSGKFNIVERNLLNKVLDELKLAQSGAVDPSSAKELGKITGVDAVVTGTIQDLVGRVAINCRLIETQTGNIFAAASEKITKDETISVMLSGTSQKKDEISNKHEKPELILKEKTEWIINQKRGGSQFVWELKSIKKLSDGRIEANLLFTNTGSYPLILRIIPADNYISDNNGNRYLYTNLIGISETKDVSLAPDSPYAAKIIYPKLEENAEVISLVLHLTNIKLK